MEGKTGRTKGKENTCRTVGITKALADSGHSTAVDIPPPWIFHRRGYSTARKGFFYFFALKFGYLIETKNPNALLFGKCSDYSYVVGVTGFEPAASWSRTKRTTKLCHTPRPNHYSTVCDACQEETREIHN